MMEDEQQKKKRVRKRPGRHKLQNRRVAQREAMARQKENQEGSDGEDSTEVELLGTLSLENPDQDPLVLRIREILFREYIFFFPKT